MALYTATVDVHLPGGEPHEFIALQHALFDAASAAAGQDDPSLGAYAHYGDDLQVTLVVKAADDADAAWKARALVLETLAHEGVEASAPLEDVECKPGRDAFDVLTALYEN